MQSTGNDTIIWTISSSVPGCLPQSKKVALNISDVPIAPASISGASAGCEGQLIPLTAATVLGATSYNWVLTSATGTSTTTDMQLTLGATTQAIVSVSASNTCGTGAATTQNIAINQKPAAPTFTASTASNNPTKLCAGASATFAVNALIGESYTWAWEKPTDKTNTPIVEGSITATAGAMTSASTDNLVVTGTNACGTGLSKKLAVNFNPIPTYSVPNDTVVCAGSPLPILKLNFTGKANYNINFTYNSVPLTATATSNSYSIPSQEGVYQLISITDANGCSNTTASKTITVTQNGLPITSYTLTGEQTCQGTDATLTMSGSELGITYNIYKEGNPRTQIGSFTGNGSAMNTTLLSSKLSSGKTIIAVDAMGCAATTLGDTANIVQIGSIAAINGKTTVCDNDNLINQLTYTFTPISGVSVYQWSINGGTVTGNSNTASVDLSAGKAGENYTLSVVAVLANNSLCTNSTASTTIYEVASYKGDSLVVSEDSICEGNAINVSLKGGSAEGYYKWHFPAGASIAKTSTDSTAFTINSNTSGTISVTPVHRCNSSIAELSQAIVVYQAPIISAGLDQKFNGFPTGAKLTGTHLNPASGVNYKYDWTLIKGTGSIVTPTSLVTNILPKEVETQYTLTVSTPNTASCSASSSVTVKFETIVTPPLIFSPNEDSKNDTWEITELEFFPDATVEIFNQWGTKVYSKSKGYFLEPWDGTSDGVQVPIATYYYVITPNKPGYASKAGAVTVVR